MSQTSWWLIDPKALATSQKVMYKEHCTLLAFSLLAVMDAIIICAIHACDEAFLGGGVLNLSCGMWMLTLIGTLIGGS